jgi:hypothetical protein
MLAALLEGLAIWLSNPYSVQGECNMDRDLTIMIYGALMGVASCSRSEN